MREEVQALVVEITQKETHLFNVKKAAECQDLEAHRLNAELCANVITLQRQLEAAHGEAEQVRRDYTGWVSPEEHQRSFTAAQERYREVLDSRSADYAEDQPCRQRQPLAPGDVQLLPGLTLGARAPASDLAYTA